MRSQNIAGYIGLGAISLVMFFVIYDIFKNPYLRIVALAPSFLLFTLNFMTLYGDFLPFKRGTLVVTGSGVIGTQVGSAIQEYSGIETRLVAFQRDQINPELKKQQEGGLYWLFDLCMGTVTIPLQGKTGVHWRDIPLDDTENQMSSAVLYLKRLDGGELRNPELISGIKQLERQSIIISHVFNAMSVLEEQIANISNLKNLDLKEMASELQLISDKVKNVKLITRGNAGSDVATVASELT